MKTERVLLAAALALVCATAYTQPRASFKACVERASIDSAQYPQRIDQGTTITGVSCRQVAGRIIYTYDNKLDALKSQLAPDALRTQANTIRTMLCTNPNLTALLKLVDMEYVYYDAANVYVGSLVNRIEDCERASITGTSAPESEAASRWSIVNRRSDGKAVLEIDRTSLVREGGTVRVWTRAVYDSSFSVEGTGSRSRKVLALNEIHCARRTERVRRVVYLGDDDRPILGSERGPYDTTDIVPGSPKESVLHAVCSPSTKN